MAVNQELELTENCQFNIPSGANNTFQSRLLFNAFEIATAHGFPDVVCNHFYLFRQNEIATEFIIESDILDVTNCEIAIECYLYRKYTNIFVAKSFAIFAKNHTPNNTPS